MDPAHGLALAPEFQTEAAASSTLDSLSLDTPTVPASPDRSPCLSPSSSVGCSILERSLSECSIPAPTASNASKMKRGGVLRTGLGTKRVLPGKHFFFGGHKESSSAKASSAPAPSELPCQVSSSSASPSSSQPRNTGKEQNGEKNVAAVVENGEENQNKNIHNCNTAPASLNSTSSAPSATVEGLEVHNHHHELELRQGKQLREIASVEASGGAGKAAEKETTAAGTMEPRGEKAQDTRAGNEKTSASQMDSSNQPATYAERAALLRQRTKDVRVKITGFATVSSSKKYVVYRVKVDAGQGCSWQVYRRFSAFLTLEYTLEHLQKELASALPAMPPRFTFELNDQLLQERAAGIDFWVRSLMSLWVRGYPGKESAGAQANEFLTNTLVGFFTEKAEQSPLLAGDEMVALEASRRGPSANTIGTDADLTSDEEDGENKHHSDSENAHHLVNTLTTGAAQQRNPSLELASPSNLSSTAGTPSQCDNNSNPDSRPQTPCKPTNGTSTCPAQQEPELPPRTVATPDPAVGQFVLRKVIGKGSFGEVFLATRNDPSGKAFAIKALGKAETVRRKQTRRIEIERRCMIEGRGCPFIVGLEVAIMTESHLFFVQEYCPGGELYFHLDVHGKFTSRLARFIAGECALALSHLHERGIVYRDLKPENIMIDADGHVKLVDFGLARTGVTESYTGAKSFVGTTEYLSPEMLNKVGHGYAVDYWALGMVLYEMLTGLPPWYSDDKKKVTKCICESQVEFPPNEVSRNARYLIRQLLTKDPRKRLGSTHGIKEISEHPYFAPLDFTKLAAKRIKPPFVPQVKSKLDTSCFDYNFTSLPARVPSHATSKNRAKDEAIIESAQDEGIWAGFAYAPDALVEKKA